MDSYSSLVRDMRRSWKTGVDVGVKEEPVSHLHVNGTATNSSRHRSDV